MSSSAQLDFVIVDVFTSEFYGGNPLAIVRVPQGYNISQKQKQTIAREFNLSETTFFHENSVDVDEDAWRVDIFMTSRELPFAGHPIVGTACYTLSRVSRERGIEDGVLDASFKLKAGRVGLSYDVMRKTAKATIPHDVHIHSKRWTRSELFSLQQGLADAQRQDMIQVKEDFPIVSIVKGMTFILVELESENALSKVSPGSQSVTVDGLDQGWDVTFICTYFYVRVESSKERVRKLRTRMIEGQLEDPATGSAASTLAAFLSLKEGKPGETWKHEIVQGVEMGRRSRIYVDVAVAADGTISEVHLEGEAVQVMEGRLTVPTSAA